MQYLNMSDSSSESEGSYHSYDDDDDDDGSGGAPPAEVEVKVNIQDVIRERKAERKLKAEKNRQTDLQRIRDMRTTTGIEPLEQFPKEIWIKIFDELDPEDRVNVWHIHPLFRDLLEDTRVRDLLPQVLKVCGPLNKKRRCINKTTRDYHDRWVADILLKQIQSKQAEAHTNDDDVVDTCFGDARDKNPMLKRLLSFYVSGSGKRFFPRALTVTLEEFNLERGNDIRELFNQFKTDVTALLGKIGDQIWQFRFFVDMIHVPFAFSDLYVLFQGWACLMPNLKWLEMSVEPPKSQMWARPAFAPFPKMPHLERLSFHTSYQPGKAKNWLLLNIYEVALTSNQNITMLDLMNGDKYSSVKKPLLPHSLTESVRLTRFTVCGKDFGVGQNISCLERIKSSVNYKWPLKTISLTLQKDPDGVSIASLLQFLEHFPTLEKVKLCRLDEFDVDDTDKVGYLKLPNLTDFEIEVTNPEIDFESNIHFFFSLQFLLECKKLEKISWKLHGFDYLKLRKHLEKCERKYQGKMIDFRGGLRYLYDSNIWKVFPALETLNVCIRKEYCEYGGDKKCEHEYLREDIEGMSVRRFLNEHECCGRDDLRSCVMLFK